MAKFKHDAFLKQTQALIDHVDALAVALKGELPQAIAIVRGEKHLPGAVSTLDQYLASLDETISGKIADFRAVYESWQHTLGDGAKS